jgi:hypothetical protein
VGDADGVRACRESGTRDDQVNTVRQ